MTDIVRDDEIRGGAPRVADTRITVLDLKRRVIDNTEDPHVVAGEYGLSMSDVFTALTFYYDHRDEFVEHEREYATARRDGERRIHEQLANEVGPTERAN